MFIGRIISESNIANKLEFIEYTDKYVGVDDIPTLFVGKKVVEKYFPIDQIKVLNKKLSDNQWWTFSKFEKRTDFESDIENFYNNIFKILKSNIKYQNINLYKLSFDKIKYLISYFNNNNSKCIYIIYNHLFIYSSNKIVYGLSLSECEYFGVNKGKLLAKIKNNPKNIIIDNFTDFLSKEFKVKLKSVSYLIPYCYFHNIYS